AGSGVADARRSGSNEATRHGQTMAKQIELEQAHLDRAYSRLAMTRREAAGLADIVAPGERGGAHQQRLLMASAIEAGRDRLESLLTDGSPLCFGRLDSTDRSEEHTSELQSRSDLVCRLLL